MANNLIQAISGMQNTYMSAISTEFGISIKVLAMIISLISAWTLLWKGLSLWKSCQKKQILWFVILLVINDFGILEILYYFVFSKLDFKDKKRKK